MKRSILAVAMMGSILVSSGCVGRAIGEASGVVFGAKSMYVEVQKLPTLPSIGPVSSEPIGNAMGTPNVPTRILTQTLRAELAEAKEFKGGTPIVLSGDVVHYETTGLVSKLLSPYPEVVVRVTAKDAAGRVIGVANVIGRGRGETSGSAEDLSKGFAKGAVKWLESALQRK